MSEHFYIKIKGEEIPVGEEIFRTYIRFEWRERKRLERERDSRRVIQIDDMDNFYQSGSSAAGRKSIEDIVSDKILLENLVKVFQQLSHEERQIIAELFFKEKSEREAAKALNLPRSTLEYRKLKILRKLKDFLES